MTRSSLTDTLQETLALFDTPGAPQTTLEVADQLDLGRQRTYERLERLANHDELETKKVGTNGRVWWRPHRTKAEETTAGEWSIDIDSVTDAVEEYAIFLLDADGYVRSWNTGAEQIKGYAAEDVLGEHVSTFYTAEDQAAGVPERNLKQATERGSIEDERWRVRNDGTKFWANVTIRALQDADGSHRGFLKVTRDMTEQYEREQALESELQRILDRISDAFYAVDEEFRFTHVNEQAEELLQRSEADLLGEVVWDVFPAARETCGDEAFHTALERQEVVSYEERFPSLERWFNVRVYPSETGLSVYFRDITERKERERELERYETIVETSPIGITIVDSDGEMQFANDRTEEIYGRSKDQINDLSFDDSEWTEVDVNGDPLPDDRKPFSQIMESGEPVFDYISGISGPDGERVWISINGAPVYDDHGAIESVVFTIENITARLERKRQLEQYETVVETAHDGIYVIDEDRRFELVNSSFADLTSFSRTELLGQPAATVFGDEFASIEAEQWGRTTSDECPAFEETIDAGPNESRTVENRFVIMDGCAQERRIGVIRDVTEREEYRQKLEESNERLEQFAYIASHDLQEPLRMITSYLQLIEQRYGETLDEDGEEFLAYAVDGAERMREMIDALLAYSRVETRGDPFEPVDLNDALEDIREDLQFQIKETDAEITTEDLPCIEGDASQLRQVFQNLLSNALAYSGDEPPRVHVGAEQRGDEWVISVADEGIGIDPDDHERIFEVFQRLHSHEERDGTGIGLALCKRIVERHGGEIWVDSEPGDGSTFSFTLQT